MPIFTAATAIATAASGAMIPGAPITLDQTSSVSVEFVSQSAGARGSLYFQATEDTAGPTYTADSDSNNLGAFVFENHAASPGDYYDLGLIDAGSTIHFAYLITKGVSVAPTGTLFSTMNADGAEHFAVEQLPDRNGATVWRVHVEDIPFDDRSDFDYNDLRFDVVAAPIPTPGAFAVASLACITFIPRRRR